MEKWLRKPSSYNRSLPGDREQQKGALGAKDQAAAASVALSCQGLDCKIRTRLHRIPHPELPTPAQGRFILQRN